MSFFSKLFGKQEKPEQETNIPASPAQKKNDHAPLVLWWIGQKKAGYDVSSNRFPKWFETTYNIDFCTEVKNYLHSGCLTYAENGNVLLSDKGKETLNYYNCIIIMHNHPEFQLSFSDFSTHKGWHTIKDEDIIWGIFNGRQQEFIKAKQWSKLAQNYLNMSTLLIEEKKYIQALDFIFSAVFISTSGMLDDNKVSPYDIDNGFLGVLYLEINNYSISTPHRNIMKLTSLGIEEVQQRFIQSQHVASLKGILPFYYLDIASSWQMLEYAILTNEPKGVVTIYDLKRQNIRLVYNLPEKNSRDYFYNSTENIIRAYKPQ